jgi:hypothetical protein
MVPAYSTGTCTIAQNTGSGPQWPAKGFQADLGSELQFPHLSSGLIIRQCG